MKLENKIFLAVCMGLLFGLITGFVIGMAYTYGQIAHVAVEIMKTQNLNIDPTILNELVTNGMARMGL